MRRVGYFLLSFGLVSMNIVSLRAMEQKKVTTKYDDFAVGGKYWIADDVYIASHKDDTFSVVRVDGADEKREVRKLKKNALGLLQCIENGKSKLKFVMKVREKALKTGVQTEKNASGYEAPRDKKELEWFYTEEINLLRKLIKAEDFNSISLDLKEQCVLSKIFKEWSSLLFLTTLVE